MSETKIPYVDDLKQAFSGVPDAEETIEQMLIMINKHKLDVSNPESYGSLYHLWSAVYPEWNFANTNLDLNGFFLLFGTKDKDKVLRRLVEEFHIPEERVNAKQRIQHLSQGTEPPLAIGQSTQSFRQRLVALFQSLFGD